MAESSQPRRWSDLPSNAVLIISRKITDVADFVRFRLVCKQWRSASDPNSFPPLEHRPWLLLPYDPRTSQRSFLSLSNLSVRTLDLPKARDRIVCGSSNGWLVLLGQTLNITLLNPLSQCLIPLPQITAVPDQSVRVDPGVGCFVHNTNTNKERMLALEELNVFFDCYAFLCPIVFDGLVAFVAMKSPKILYWKPGLDWAELDLGLRGRLMTIAFHKDRFYAIDDTGSSAVWAVGPRGEGSAVGSVDLLPRYQVKYRYLIEVPEGMLLVTCRKDIRPRSIDVQGRVEYRFLDGDKGTMAWSEIGGGVLDCMVVLSFGVLPGKGELTAAARSARGHRKNRLYTVFPRKNEQRKGQKLSDKNVVIIEDYHLQKYRGPWMKPHTKLQSSAWFTPRLN